MDDRLQASDADRDRAAARLCGHFAAGRLTAGELDRRLTAALQARTLGDLRRALADLPGPAPAAQQASRLAARPGALERGYRRLLVCYPAWYRRVHGDEILGVLMTQAPEGKRRPGIGEAADLLAGALRVRCQPSRRAGTEPAWRDALAVVSLILPVALVVTYAVGEIQWHLSIPAEGPWSYGFPLGSLPNLAPPLAIAALALVALGMRRAAAMAAAGLLIWLASGMASRGTVLAVGDDYLYLALGLEIAALTASPGPRRAVQILTWRDGAFAVIATLAVGTVALPTTPTVRLIMLAVISAGMALASSLGRWVLALLAIPGYPFFLGFSFSPPGYQITTAFLPFSAAWVAPFYLPPLALLALAIVAARRESLHRYRSALASLGAGGNAGGSAGPR